MVDIYGTDVEFSFVNNDVLFSNYSDFATITGISNLQQAILNRLYTPKGELISHLSYGSNLNLLIGAPQDATTQASAISYIYTALADEARITTINDVIVGFTTLSGKTYLDITLNYTPVNSVVPETLVIQYNI